MTKVIDLYDLKTLRECRNEARKIKIEKQSLIRQIHRNLTFCCLLAGHSLYRSILSSRLADIKNDWSEAERLADFVNSLFHKNTPPSDFIYSPEEETNKCLKYYADYTSYVKLLDGKERLIRSFAQWYAKSKYDTSFLKIQIHFIILVSWEIEKVESGQKSLYDFTAFIDRLKSTDYPVNFDARSVLKAFCQARDNVIEIERKIQYRPPLGPEKTPSNEKD